MWQQHLTVASFVFWLAGAEQFTAAGRIVVPAWGHTLVARDVYVAAMLYSDDHGESWHIGQQVPDLAPGLRKPNELQGKQDLFA